MLPGDDDDHEWWLNVEPETIRVALTLAQTAWWVDSEGTPHWVDSMTARHRRAVTAYLLPRARDLLVAVQETSLRARPDSAPHRAADQLLADAPTLAGAEGWLESTPLIRRLRQLNRSSQEQ